MTAALQSVASGVVKTALQPIISLRDDRVFAFEALTRVRGIEVGELFARAVRCDRTAELNVVAIESALDATPVLPPGALLFVNVDPVVLAMAELPDAVITAAEAAGFPLSRVVLEITERTALVDLSVTRRVIDRLREADVRFALDDFGSAHSHLGSMQLIGPSFIKIGHGFGSAFERCGTNSRIVPHIAALAHAFGCSTILEGIESEATAAAGRQLGIEYGQGFHFGGPVVPLVNPLTDRGAVHRVPHGIL